MRTFFLTIAMACALGACQSTGTAHNANSEENVEVASADGPTVYCRNERSTGSNLRTRVCRTAEQVEQDRDEAERMLRDNVGQAASPRANGG